MIFLFITSLSLRYLLGKIFFSIFSLRLLEQLPELRTKTRNLKEMDEIFDDPELTEQERGGGGGRSSLVFSCFCFSNVF